MLGFSSISEYPISTIPVVVVVIIVPRTASYPGGGAFADARSGASRSKPHYAVVNEKGVPYTQHELQLLREDEEILVLIIAIHQCY